MAINSREEGGHEYDPSKRIRVSLGEEFVSNVEAESTERLAQAMASTPVKNNGREYDEEGNDDMGKIKDLIGKVKHSNPKEESSDTGRDRKISYNVRLENVKLTEKRLGDMISKKPVFETIVRESTGFGIKDTSKQNLEHALNFGLKNAVSFIGANLIEPIVSSYNPADKNERTKAVAASICTASLFDAGASLLTDDRRINTVFDQNNISATESKIINSAIWKEKIKYAAEHTLAGVIIPSFAKIGITKAIGQDTINKNKILEAVTSFGTLSTIGKTGLSIIRKISEKKELTKLNAQQYTVVENEPTKYYSDLAKLATNHVINDGIDNTLTGTVVGTIFGIKAKKDINESMGDKKPTVNGYMSQQPTTPTKTTVKTAVESSKKPAEKPASKNVAISSKTKKTA